MRVIAVSTLRAFADAHPTARSALMRWASVLRASAFRDMGEVQGAFGKAKVLNGERVRFPIAGGAYRLIAAFDFERQIVFVKFVGTHAEYDAVDALTVSQF